MRSRRDTTEEWVPALVARLLVATFGGYVFASGAAAVVAALLATMHLPRAQAAETAALAGLVLYFAVAPLAFAAGSVRRLAVILVGGGAVLLCLAAMGA